MHTSRQFIADIRPRAPQKPVARTTTRSHVSTQPTVHDVVTRPAAPTRQSLAPQPRAATPHTTATTHAPTQPVSPKATRPTPQLTIAEHLQELRSRLLWSVIALFIGGAFGYYFHEQIIAILIKPLGQQLYYTSPAGGFDFLIKTCLFFGFILAIPVLVYQLLKFLAPAVPGHVVYKTSRILLVSVLLAIAGMAFAYFVSLPAALHFLNNFSTGPVTSLIGANEYFSFVMIYVAGFAALFQMPLIIAFINKITPLTPKIMMRKQRFVILGSFIIAAILTPTPDPINQTIMAVPIIALYQSSICVVWQSNYRSRKKQPYSQLRSAATSGATA